MKTCLYDRHIKLKAKMVDFSGWEMPLQYSGIIQEHLAVRNHVGIFDVSHMERLLIDGVDAEKFLDLLCTNKIVGKSSFSATYTLMANKQGGTIDDVIVYKKDKNHFFMVINAGNREKDLKHLKQEAQSFNVNITPLVNDGILAIQGPHAVDLVKKIFPEATDLKTMHFRAIRYDQEEMILSATGYTGAGGFEIYGSSELVVKLWDRFFEEDQSFGLLPIGLGARDTLRLEKGYALYGHELSEEIVGTESVSAWTVKMDKANFIGKEAIQELENSPKKRYSYGVILKGQGIARQDYEVWKDGKLIGKVTSGTFSPSLNKAIALVLVNTKLTLRDKMEIQIRQNRVPAEVVKLPFL